VASGYTLNLFRHCLYNTTQSTPTTEIAPYIRHTRISTKSSYPPPRIFFDQPTYVVHFRIHRTTDTGANNDLTRLKEQSHRLHAVSADTAAHQLTTLPLRGLKAGRTCITQPRLHTRRVVLHLTSTSPRPDLHVFTNPAADCLLCFTTPESTSDLPMLRLPAPEQHSLGS
jgi:hypothetical protein